MTKKNYKLVLKVNGQALLETLTVTLSQCHSHTVFRELVEEEEVWVARARAEFGVCLRTGQTFSPRQFYQAWLHR